MYIKSNGALGEYVTSQDGLADGGVSYGQPDQFASSGGPILVDSVPEPGSKEELELMNISQACKDRVFAIRARAESGDKPSLEEIAWMMNVQNDPACQPYRSSAFETWFNGHKELAIGGAILLALGIGYVVTKN